MNEGKNQTVITVNTQGRTTMSRMTTTIYRSVAFSFLLGSVIGTPLLAGGVNPNRPMNLRGKAAYNTNLKSFRPKPEAAKVDAKAVASRAAEALREGRHGEAAQMFERCAELREAEAAKLEHRAKRVRTARPAPLAMKPGLQSGRFRAAALERRARSLRTMAVQDRGIAENQRRLSSQVEIMVD